MPDRKSGPEIFEIDSIQLPEFGKFDLPGGSEVHYLQTAYSPVVRMEIIIDAGRLKEDFPLQSRATAALLKDGSKNFSREQISEIADRTGGSISITAGLEFASILIHCLESQIDKILEIVGDILLYPSYSQKHLRKYIQRRKNRLKEDLSINEVLAYRKLTEELFGPNHPYGYNSTANKYDRISLSTLKEFHQMHYRSGNMKVFLSCQHPLEIGEKLNQLWSNIPAGYTLDNTFETPAIAGGKTEVKAANYAQASIRVGKKLFPRNHPDFAGMYFLNTVLGGFFGSRLTAEVREKQGLTYNVFSTIETFKMGGFFLAGCETKILNVDRVVDLLFLEFEKMRMGLVPDPELQLVKNYLFGFFTSMLDGPVNTMELYKLLITEGGNLESFDSMIEDFRKMDGNALVNLANKYLKTDEMRLVIVR
ncbi:MAG: insulinase family protein [Saprospirales bacterium]|nr:MAG: insulinase family protein [Saprospirales bacterium]